MRVLLYAKLLKETEETIVFFVTFLSLVAFQLGRAPPSPPLATPMANAYKYALVNKRLVALNPRFISKAKAQNNIFEIGIPSLMFRIKYEDRWQLDSKIKRFFAVSWSKQLEEHPNVHQRF